VNPYIPVAPHGIDPSLAVGITNPGGPNPLEGNVLLCSVRSPLLTMSTTHQSYKLQTTTVARCDLSAAALAVQSLISCILRNLQDS